jgi:hypothetical protein
MSASVMSPVAVELPAKVPERFWLLFTSPVDRFRVEATLMMSSRVSWLLEKVESKKAFQTDVMLLILKLPVGRLVNVLLSNAL